MRVAMLSYHTCPLAALGGKDTGGMNVYVRELTRSLGKAGIRVDVFTRSQDEHVPHVIHDLGNGNRVIHIPAGPEIPLPRDEWSAYVPAFAEAIGRFAVEQGEPYNLIHSHYWLSGLAGLTLQREWKIPLVHMFHTLGEMKTRLGGSWEDPLRRQAEETILAGANRIVAATPAERMQLQMLYRADIRKIVVIPPGVDTELFYPVPVADARERIGLARDAQMILYVGRIERLKGLETLLRAAAILQTQGLLAPSCPCVALIVNAEGFPLSYETFDGDRTDVTSLEAVMRMVERKYGRARRIWVFDRGIVSEANLAALRKRGGQYLVGTPRSKLKGMERQLLQGTWTQVREEVEAQLVPLPGGTETYVLCRSTARREKERAIRRRFSGRMERALTSLAQRVEKGQLKDRSKIERRLGKIQERYVQVADLYEADLRQTEGRWVLRWNLIEERRAWREAREGAYLLRTNLEGATVEELWTKYIQLTEAEAAFRALKSELSIRPLFHQLEPRVKAHILVAFLGYSLWVTLKHLLRRKNSACSPAPSTGAAGHHSECGYCSPDHRRSGDSPAACCGPHR